MLELQRRHFEFIAGTIAELTPSARVAAARQFAQRCGGTNYKFNRGRFLEACGLQPEEIEMALVTWHIEVRTDFADKKKNKLFEKALRQMAHEAIATASLLADGRQPDIALSTHDMFVGKESLLLFDEETVDHE